jgi:CRP/FNR family cyclic AMP-dependent transcriptional regulator
MILCATTVFDPAVFLANAGLGRRIVELQPKEAFFAQGDLANSVFYLQKGRAKVTVVSQVGKEATITLLGPRDFVGEEALAAVPGLRLASATAITACTAPKIGRAGNQYGRALHQSPYPEERRIGRK